MGKLINEELKSNVHNLAIKSVELLLNHVNEYVPDYRSTKYEHQLQSPFYMMKLRSMSEVLFDSLVTAHRHAIEQLSEFKDCLTILDSDQIISKQINQQLFLWDGALFANLFEYLRKLLSNTTRYTYEKGKFDEDTFFHEYSNLETFLYNKKIAINVIVPLYNIIAADMDLTSVVSMDMSVTSINLRQIKNSEKNRLFYLSDIDKMGLVGQSQHVLEINYQEQKRFGDQHVEILRDKIISLLQDIVTSLRLLKQGNIGALTISFKPQFGRMESSALLDHDSMAAIFTNPLRLDINDINKLSDLLRLIRFEPNDNLKLALSRFNSSYSKTDRTDKLIDLMICYEALFSLGQSDSVSHKLALRFSRLSWLDPEVRQEKYRQMRELYNSRSSVMHGGTHKVGYGEVYEVEEYMRISLRNYIFRMFDFKDDHKALIDSLDFD